MGHVGQRQPGGGCSRGFESVGVAWIDGSSIPGVEAHGGTDYEL